MSGPYDVNGLSDGFASGFGLALAKKRADLEQQKTQDELKTSAQQRDIQAAQEGRAAESAQYGITLRPLQEQAAKAGIGKTQAETAEAQARVPLYGAQAREAGVRADVAEKTALPLAQAEVEAKKAGAARDRAYGGYLGSETTQKTQQNKAQQQLLDNIDQQAKSAADRVDSYPDEVFTDPRFPEKVHSVEAFTKGHIDPNNPVQHQDVLDVFNAMHAKELNYWNGRKVTPEEAKEFGVPEGSTVTSTKASEFRINPQKGTVILDLTKTFNGPDGKPITPAAYTLAVNKDLYRDAEPLELPISKLADFATANGNLAEGIDRARKAGQPITREGLKSEIQAAAAAHKVEVTTPKSVVSSAGNIHSLASGQDLDTRYGDRSGQNAEKTKEQFFKLRTDLLKSKGDPNTKAAHIAALDKAYGYNDKTGEFAGSPQPGFDSSATNPTQLGQPDGSPAADNPYLKFVASPSTQ